MKKLVILVLTILVSSSLNSLFLSPVLAASNNKVGIHVIQPEDLTKAAELVNSSGGDWGYVTIVIQETDRNFDKWQKFFDACREKHLIPLVRLATHLNGDTWEKPTEASIDDWANFLNSLNWPVKTQYIIVFNEPNHAKEWGGSINPGEYAQILDKALTVFKEKNPDFVILNAGLDQAAPNSSSTMDEAEFLKQMNDKTSGIFSRLDGWVSHSYPNHGFIGKPWETGKATVKGYEWEFAVLKESFGFTKDLSVFISETGWPHKVMTNGKDMFLRNRQTANFYGPDIASEYLKQAFENVWLKDKKVLVVTPFILNYPDYPFANFSWLDSQGKPYPQYEEIKSISKIKAEPEQKQSFEQMSLSLPPFLTTNFVFYGKVVLENTGQSIWGEKEFRLMALAPGLKLTDLSLPADKLVKPKETVELPFTLEAPPVSGGYTISWEGLGQYNIKVFDVWGLTATKTSLINSFLENLFKFLY